MKQKIKKRMLMFTMLSIGTSGYMNGQSPTILHDVEIQDSLDLEYLGTNSAKRSLAVDKNGNVGLTDANAAQVYRVAHYSDIANLDVVPNSIIYTDIGGKYLVETTGTTQDVVVIETSNQLYAVLQLRDGGYYIEDFGATPDDASDDDAPAIQYCIEQALRTIGPAKVNAGPGTFDLDDGVVIAEEAGTYYRESTLTLSGHIPVYSSNNGVGNVTVFRLRTSTFCVAVQKGRNSVIENIMFLGGSAAADQTTGYQGFSQKDMIEMTKSDWNLNNTVRDNRYSPDCAIAIDPFWSGISTSNQYPNHADRYKYSSVGGSSMITVRNCGFRYFYIGIANNPSGYILNGDNVRAEHCHVKNLYAFWAAGQTQARSNSIENIYSIAVSNFVDCSLIGSQQGTPPTIANCNLAGFTKQLVYMTKSGFSPIRISDTYAESIFSLGYMNANNISFHQCQFKFIHPENGNGIWQAPYHLRASDNVSFVDCGIEYNAGPSVSAPFRFLSKGLNIIGGNIKGGIIVNGSTNTFQLNQIIFQNVLETHTGKLIGSRINGGNATTALDINNEIMVGGQEFHILNTVDQQLFKNNSRTYNSRYYGTMTVTRIDSLERAFIKLPSNIESGQFQVGDNLMSASGGIIASTPGTNILNMQNLSSYQSAFGFVDEIKQDTIFIAGIPYNFTEGSMGIHKIDYPIFFSPIWADFTLGSNQITAVTSLSGASLKTLEGQEIYSEATLKGTYIDSVVAATKVIYLSTNATQTLNEALLYNAKYKQTVYRKSDTWPFTQPYPYLEGCQIFLDNINTIDSVYGYIVTKGGIIGNSVAPSISKLKY